MSIYQLESGHAVPESGIGALSPVFTVHTSTTFTAIAGDEATDAPEPSLYLETSVVVGVTWRLRLPGMVRQAPEAPEAPRTRRGARPEVVPAVVDNDLIVGLAEVVVSNQSSSLVESRQFAGLASFQKDDEDDVDYQAHVHKYVQSIGAIHTKIRAQALETVPTDDPLAAPQVDHQKIMDQRISKLREILDEVQITGIDDVLDTSGNSAQMQGLFELRHGLAAIGVTLEPEVEHHLLELPLLRKVTNEIMDDLESGGYVDSVDKDQQSEQQAA